MIEMFDKVQYLMLMIYERIMRRVKIMRLRTTALARVKKIRESIDILKDADILVLGSAPHPVLPKGAEDMLLVCCNGSAANAKQLGMKSPVMTVVDFELIDPVIAFSKSVRSDIIINKILADLDLGILVATQSNSAIGSAPEILNAHFNRYVSIDQFARLKILDIISGTDKLERDVRISLCSTGAFAVAISLFLGARSVHISGFTLVRNVNDNVKMHFYEDSELSEASLEWDTRNHSMADSALITLSVINGHIIRTHERDLLPLTQNWGNQGFD